MPTMKDSESNDFSDSEYEVVDTENSGSDSSACSPIEDNSSRHSDSDDLPASRQMACHSKNEVASCLISFYCQGFHLFQKLSNKH